MNKTFIINVFKFVFSYLKDNLYEDIKVALPKAAEAFREVLWKEVKEQVHLCAVEAIGYVEQFYMSEDMKRKKELILADILNRIKLPILLKPFKGLIKKIISNKLDELLASILTKGKQFIA